MKLLKVFKKIEEEYRVGERAETHPQEFVKDIVYKAGVWSVIFSPTWFKSFNGMSCEYSEMHEEHNTNKDRLIN